MTGSIHPHWQSMDDEERPVPVRSAESPQATRPTIQRASRMPAAVIGVLVMAVLGIGLLLRDGTISGQLQNEDVLIQITDAGLSPSTIMVEPGGLIRWDNASSIPHILTSNTLLDEDGTAWITPAILPGSFFEFVIPLDATEGMFDYESQTSADISGTIIIAMALPDDVPLPQSSNAALPPVLSSSSSSSMAPAFVPQVATASSSSAMAPSGAIPQNPHTIGSGEFAIPTRSGAPQAVPQAPQASVTAHKPLAQPNSGAGLALAALSFIAALAFVVRKAAV
jgi:plastocyanin